MIAAPPSGDRLAARLRGFGHYPEQGLAGAEQGTIVGHHLCRHGPALPAAPKPMRYGVSTRMTKLSWSAK
jgi:hypothetical protein